MHSAMTVSVYGLPLLQEAIQVSFHDNLISITKNTLCDWLLLLVN